IIIVGYRYSALATRITRSSILDAMRQDHVRTAAAKGLGRSTVVFRHVIPNALIPMITVAGTQFVALLNALVVIEVLFVIPGLGSMAYNAVLGRDYPVVQGTILVFAVFAVVVNIIVDLAYSVVDPRIRL